MKISGVEPSGPSEEVLVLPRANGDIVFKARAVTDMTAFNNQCPPPKAPGRLVAGGKWEANVDAPAYREQLEKHAELRMGYIVINSLQDIEWDTVDIDQPSTWSNWMQDLKSAGFSDTEVNRVLVLCLQANCLDEAKLKEAREAFLLGQGAMKGQSSGLSTEQESTQFGEPAKDSE